MLALQKLAGFLSSLDADVFGEVVRDGARKLQVIAVSGAKDHFRNERSPGGIAWPKLKHARPGGGNRVLRDKGLLMASISASVTEGELRLTASHPGANVHQFGATIKPKRAKKLAIPLTREAKRAGRPRDFPRPLKWRPTSGPSSLLYEVTGKRTKKVVMHFVLVDEVVIPARRFLGFSAETLGKIMYTLATDFNAKLFQKLKRSALADLSSGPVVP
jgi:phage gpG-like protein